MKGYSTRRPHKHKYTTTSDTEVILYHLVNNGLLLAVKTSGGYGWIQAKSPEQEPPNVRCSSDTLYKMMKAEQLTLVRETKLVREYTAAPWVGQ